MPRTKRLTDDDVLRLAREVILARGPGVSTVEIAAHVGLKQPTLFQRFGDKATLVRRALAPDPVTPAAITGPEDELAVMGPEGHVGALTGRLFDTMLSVVERAQAGGGMFRPDAQDKAHELGGATVLVPALAAHFGRLDGLRLQGDLAVETLLMLVHGAAAMALAAPVAERSVIRDRLQIVVKSALIGD